MTLHDMAFLRQYGYSKNSWRLTGATIKCKQMEEKEVVSLRRRQGNGCKAFLIGYIHRKEFDTGSRYCFLLWIMYEYV